MHLLIVDDERNIRRTLRDILEDDGHRVSEAPDGEQGIELADAEHPDIVLLDVRLPGRDGIEVLDEIKRCDPAVEIIMISGHSGIETAVEATKRGAYDFLEKPLSLPKIRLAVEHLVEKIELRRQVGGSQRRKEMIGQSSAMERLKEQIARVAPTNASVLISGESGTGKELVASHIHLQSARAAGPFVQVNCAAIPRDLIESELFGHEKGSFTGATAQRPGKFEVADGGTIFLDEIGDMAIEVQAKVLRTLQEGELQRVGGTQTLHVDVRVISATNKGLEEEVGEGRFREDLLYRLNVIPISVPPLRERPLDIPPLADHFLKVFCAENGREPMALDDEAMTRISMMPYKGNIRELQNLVDRLALFSTTSTVTEFDVEQALGPATHDPSAHFTRCRPLADAKNELEKLYIETQLQLHGWDVPTTAAALGILPNNLHRKITQLSIERPHRKKAPDE